ncbi:MAG TPA: cytochrome c, partial [Candidatus Baltobacteraceae bacterium]|nr:cytochrome c [Candidatus Baltobacteraceae bacterium]
MDRLSMLALCALLGAVATATGSSAATTSDFTAAQAAQGGEVYVARCSVCHGGKLQGQSGPALAGPSFRQSIDASYPTAAALYQFTSTQMPADAPGSLSQAQYLAVTAFLISKNGLAPGSTPLALANAKSFRIAGAAGTAQSQTSVEIVRAPPPSRQTFAAIPSAANLVVTDEMLRGAAADPKNWLMGGRT